MCFRLFINNNIYDINEYVGLLTRSRISTLNNLVLIKLLCVTFSEKGQGRHIYSSWTQKVVAQASALLWRVMLWHMFYYTVIVLVGVGHAVGCMAHVVMWWSWKS